jgi:type IX secretion system substrate protein
MFRKLTILLLITALLPMSFVGQNFQKSTAKIRKAYYSDKTPPLKNMKIVLPGERKRSWKDEVVQNDERDESELFSSFNQPEIDIAQQKSMGNRNVDGPIVNFAGVGRITNLTPPDTDGDVGPNHYFQMVNVSFAIWDKEGNLLYGPVDNSTLWNGFIGPWTGTNDGDPIVIYDEIEDRWIATQFAVNTNDGTYWELMAISETPDPLGSYYRYAFQYNIFNDYPKFSSWPDGYYATYNMFNNGYAGSTIVAFEKDSMLVGSSNARVVEFGPFPDLYGTNTSDFDGTILPPTGSPNWVVNLNKYGTPQTLEVYKFEVDWTNPANSSFVLWDDLTVTPFSFFNPGIREQLPQPNTSQKLDPLSKYSMYPLKYRNFGSHESMTINHTVKVGSRAGVRWYELRKDDGQTQWYIFQEGTYAPEDTLSRWMGSIAMNANGDIALGYSVTGENVFPSVRYTGRSSTSPSGEMDVDEITIIGGSGSQSGSARWGDYSYMSVDPVDDTTFWFTQEYIVSSWETRIAAFTLTGDLLLPIANAGNDTVVCIDYPFFAQGEAENSTSVLWSTLGDGNFQNPTTLNPVYIRGPQDIENGYFELALTASGYQQGMVDSDTVYIEIVSNVSIDAGSDTIICSDESFITQPDIHFGDSIVWSTSGDGFFNDSSLLNAIYTPGNTDIENGSVVLSLFARAIAPCQGVDTDALMLVIDPCPNVEENRKTDFTLDIYPNPTPGVLNINVSTVYDQEFSISILDLQGHRVFTGTMNTRNGQYTNQLDFSYFSDGIYYVTIRSFDKTITKKIVVN